ncbi:MAG TPA: RNase adapter RapZ [Acidimicrobiales bacterium]|nr:RNase adapter RapZ [Acidimicrobiales bacterium]
MSEYLVVGGMSGAGRSSAAAYLEDIGWFVIDNLPPALIGKVAELTGQRGSEYERIALIIGPTGSEAIDEVQQAISKLRTEGSYVRILFLDAPDDVLIRRYEGTRRPHPLEALGVHDAIARERELLQPLLDDADEIIETGEMNVHELRARLIELYAASDGKGRMAVSMISFGFKHGLPIDADVVLDCRFLPNPHWVPELRPFTGLDEPVRSFVMKDKLAQEFVDRVDDLLELCLPAFVTEGKSYVSIAVGCTGGQHRSVAIVEELANRVRGRGFVPAVRHRDIAK